MEKTGKSGLQMKAKTSCLLSRHEDYGPTEPPCGAFKTQNPTSQETFSHTHTHYKPHTFSVRSPENMLQTFSGSRKCLMIYPYLEFEYFNGFKECYK